MSIKENVRQIVNRLGYDLTRIREVAKANHPIGTFDEMMKKNNLKKIHYGCGSRVFDDGWINVDLPIEPVVEGAVNYLPINLIASHPFQDNYFEFAFAEDFLEHLTQPESIIFLAETYRTLKPGGVLRLSFPGLKGVLKKHYLSSDYSGAARGQYEAYTLWGHHHFYSEESLTMVASHLGYSSVDFVVYGESRYSQLSSLDTRIEQKDLNIYVELTK